MVSPLAHHEMQREALQIIISRIQTESLINGRKGKATAKVVKSTFQIIQPLNLPTSWIPASWILSATVSGVTSILLVFTSIFGKGMTRKVVN